MPAGTEDLAMDGTLATTWLLCGLGLAVAGYAAASTPRHQAGTSEHQRVLTRAHAASINGEIDAAVTFFVTRTAGSSR